MLINRKKDMTPFDLKEKPAKQYPFLMPLIWGGSFLLTRQFGLKISRVHMEGLKPPYLVLSTHQGFSDYYIGPLVLFPHRGMYVSDMEGYAGFGKWLYRGLGCIGKRRYVPDLTVMENIRYGLQKGQSVVVFPESRHSNIGTTAKLPKNLGRLVKALKVPLVIVSVHGSYLANPFWDEEHTRKVPMEVTVEGIGDAKALSGMSAEEIQSIIENKLFYDEYAYQHEKGFLITVKNRAVGLEKPLYMCRKCGQPNHMITKNDRLICEACNSSFVLTEDGWLREQAAEKIHLPDWYEWQREVEISRLREKQDFQEEYRVQVEALPSEKGFVDLGEGTLLFNQKEFILCFQDVQGKEKKLHFPHSIRESVQTEYNYRGKGMCIVLSTTDCCYYLYSKEPNFQATRLQFMGEYLYDQNCIKKGQN